MKTLTNFLIDFARTFIADEHGGSLAIEAYGAPVTPTGTISVTRGNLSTVGEAVHFTVTGISGLTVSAGPYTAYDPLDHEVEWKWTITPPSGGGEPTTWTAPTRNISTFKDRLTAWGRQGFFIPQVATGTYTIAVEGRDGSGNVLSESTTFDVVSWDSVSTAAQTYIIYDGSDLTGAPSHNTGNRYTTWADAWNAAETKSGVVRFAFLGGYAAGGSPSIRGTDAPSSIICHTYGTGAAGLTRMAKLRSGNDKTVIFCGDFEVINGTDYDATNGAEATLTTFNNALELTDFQGWGSFSGIYMRGFDTTILQATGGNADGLWFEDCTFADKINYHAYFSNGGYVAGWRGCNMDMPAASLAGGTRYQDAANTRWRNQHGNIRTAQPITLLLDGNQMFTNNGWSPTSDYWPSHQPNVRFNQSAGNGGGTLIATRNLFEGPGIRGNSYQSSSDNNMLVERNIFLHTTQGSAYSCSSLDHKGWTIRNNIYLGSSAARDPGAAPSDIRYKVGFSPVSSSTDPVRVYYNTFVDNLSGAYNGDHCGVSLDASPGAGSVEANLTYAPNYDTPLQPDGALTAQTGVTVHGTYGSALGWTIEPISLTLAAGATTGPFSWFNDVDGNPVNAATFAGSAGLHEVVQPSSVWPTDTWSVTFSDNGDGTFDLTNTSGGTISGSGLTLQLDRRHDIVKLPGSASATTDGRLWAPSANVSSAGGSLDVPYWDFFGNVRSGTACKGAIHVAA